MNMLLFGKAVIALVLIVGLVLLLAKLAQHYLAGGKLNLYNQQREIKVLERLPLDAKRHLVRLRDRHHCYLILLGNRDELLLDKQALEKSDDQAL